MEFLPSEIKELIAMFPHETASLESDFDEEVCRMEVSGHKIKYYINLIYCGRN